MRIVTGVQLVLISGAATAGIHEGVRVFFKPDYNSLDIVCADEKCRWSIPFPVGFLEEMRKFSSKDLKTRVTGAMGELPVLVDITSNGLPGLVTDHPFGGVKIAVRDDHFGPVLVKKFADYDIITCQSNAKSGNDGRVLLTYAVKSDEKRDGVRLTTGPGIGGVFANDSKRMTVFAAKFAHLIEGTVDETTAKKFCYALTNVAHRIYEKFGITIDGDDAKEALLYEFEKIQPIESAEESDYEGGGE